MSNPVEVSLLGRSLTIITDEGADDVQAAANLVQEHVEELRQMGTTVASDRLLMLVALNLAGELLKSNQSKVDGVDDLITALDGVVSQAEGLAKAPLR